MEKIQKDLAHNHRLIPVQELEEKAVVLKQLGETLTDLKGERGPWGCTSVPSAPPEPTQGPPAACWCLALQPLSCAVPPRCARCHLHSVPQCKTAELRIWLQSLRLQEDVGTVGTRGGHRAGVAAALLSCNEMAQC